MIKFLVMDNVLGGICVSYMRINMWEDSTTSAGPGLTYKNNIKYKKMYIHKRYIELWSKHSSQSLDIK